MFNFIRNIFQTKSKTRLISANKGLLVELDESMPDSYANILEECLATGEIIEGTINSDGQFIKKE